MISLLQWNLWHRQTLGRRLFSALSVLIVSVWTISIVNGTRLDALDAQRVLARHLDEETRILPTEVADDLVLGDFGALEQTLNQKLTRTELAAVRYRDAAGTRLDLQEADEGNHGVPYWFIRLTGLQPISGQANAIIGGRHYGTFTITLTPIEEVTRLWQRLLERIRTLGMTLTVLMLGIWLVLRSSLKPLAQFDVALQQLAKGNLDTRLKPAGSPELRRAMKTFNFMTQSLASARQALLAESERTRVTLASIGDGVIAIDAQGRVEYMNPMAESLTGWQLNEVIGLQGEEVFHLIDENTRAAIDWPLLQVLQEKRPLRLASNTLLITRFGKSFPVEDSAAPIFDRDGHSVIGAVLVFHDQSDTRAQLNRLREREAQLSAVINTSPIGILVISPLGDIQRANRAACQALGWEESELPSIFALTHPDDLPASLQHYSALGNNQASTVTLEKRYQRRNRDYFWSETVLTPLTDDNGKQYAMLVMLEDITHRREANEQLKLAASVFHHAQEGIMLTDAKASIINVNPAFCLLTGYSREEAIGKNPNFLKSGYQPETFYRDMWQSVLEQGHWRGEIWNQRKSGDIYPELLSIAAVHNPAGAITNYIGIFSDISLLKEQQNNLERQAHYDMLTQLPNRILLTERLEAAMHQSQQDASQLAICYLDLDGFKAVNDSQGHATGDKLLIEVAQRLKDALRGGDTVSRLGGDEFVLLLSHIGERNALDDTMRRLLQVIAMPYKIAEQPFTISASIGVTLYPNDDANPDALLRHADQAMYIAKQYGRNRYHLFDPEHSRRLQSRNEAQERVVQALHQNELVLYYQPKVDMRHGTIIGAEALIRWQHPQRGLLSPYEFLPAIEDTEWMDELGEWVITHALTQMQQWRDIGLVLPVSINLSGHHLLREDFIPRLKQHLADYPALAKGQLELEVLESAALSDIGRVSEVIRACQKLGVRFALDDFGTGYASLAYLRRLPADVLKIDQTFVHDMLSDSDDRSIVEGVVSLARTFRRQVIAEGMETPEHGALLIAMGCDLAQGYCVARPMSAAALPGWIEQYSVPPLWNAAACGQFPSEDLSLFSAAIHHWGWCEQVEQACLKTDASDTDSTLERDSTQCVFGKWFHGQGYQQYGQFAGYHAVMQAHKNVHELAEQMLGSHREHGASDAEPRLPALHDARDRLLAALKSLANEVKVARDNRH